MEDTLDAKDLLPEVPIITEEQLETARKTGRYEAVAFEEYKFVAQIVALLARISNKSKDFKKISTQEYHVLMGLMNRCGRLMLGTMELSHKGKFAETTAIIFRCISETGIKIIWLCTDPSLGKFAVYVNDGLKPEIELKDIIESKVKASGDKISIIEDRMLKSIERNIKYAETTEHAIRSSGRMPNMAYLTNLVGFDRTMYVTFQRLGSHNVHGTWHSLFTYYLEEAGDELVPRGNDSSTHANEYLGTAFIMARAIRAYSEFSLGPTTAKIFIAFAETIEREVLNIFNDMAQNGW
jgi:hypothetical protein